MSLFLKILRHAAVPSGAFVISNVDSKSACLVEKWLETKEIDPHFVVDHSTEKQEAQCTEKEPLIRFCSLYILSDASRLPQAGVNTDTLGVPFLFAFFFYLMPFWTIFLKIFFVPFLSIPSRLEKRGGNRNIISKSATWQRTCLIRQVARF